MNKLDETFQNYQGMIRFFAIFLFLLFWHFIYDQLCKTCLYYHLKLTFRSFISYFELVLINQPCQIAEKITSRRQGYFQNQQNNLESKHRSLEFRIVELDKFLGVKFCKPRFCNTLYFDLLPLPPTLYAPIQWIINWEL